MKINLKFLKPKKKFKKRGYNIKPHLYWQYILLMTFVIIFGSCAFGWYLFLKIEETSGLSIINIEDQNQIQKDRINNTLEYFENRKEKSLEILNSPSPIVDPSI